MSTHHTGGKCITQSSTTLRIVCAWYFTSHCYLLSPVWANCHEVYQESICILQERELSFLGFQTLCKIPVYCTFSEIDFQPYVGVHCILHIHTILSLHWRKVYGTITACVPSQHPYCEISQNLIETELDCHGFWMISDSSL